jgi:hypothetical protein
MEVNNAVGPRSSFRLTASLNAPKEHKVKRALSELKEMQ